MKNLIKFFVDQHLFGILLAVFTILIGLGSLYKIQREVFPNVSFDIITVLTIFPGATAEEVEKLITNPLEKDIKELDGIDKLTSKSSQGLSTIVVQLDPDDTTEEEAKSDLRDIVDRFKPELPDGAEDPVITALESKLGPLIEVHVLGDIPALKLRTIAKEIKEKLEDIDGIARISSEDLRDLEIRVEASQKRLSRYHLSLEDLIRALKRQNMSIPGGTIEEPDIKSERGEFSVRTTGQFVDLTDVRDTVIRANDLGKAVRVSDVAKVYFDLEKVSVKSRTSGKPSIPLRLLKKESVDAINLVNIVKKHIEKIKTTLDPEVGIELVNDASFYIKRRLSVLTNNLVFGLILVIILLSLLLPRAIAVLVSVGIPFSFLGTVFYFYGTDNSINLISLVGFIIVSGMLVDDAIVVTDNCVREIQEGIIPPKDAAVKGAHDIFLPVTASVTTTIVAFSPLMFMTGIFGKFVNVMPLAVIVALLISLVEAFFILPAHVVYWLKPKKLSVPSDQLPVKPKGRFLRFWESKIVPIYERLLKMSLEWRYVTAFLGFAFLGASFFAAYNMRIVLFPPEDIDIFVVRAQAPTGSSLEKTTALMKPIEKTLNQLPKEELLNFYTAIGIHRQGMQVLRTGSEFAESWVFLTQRNERKRSTDEILLELREKFKNPEGLVRLTFDRIKHGPPQGAAVSLGVRAKSYEDIMPAINHLKEILSKEPGVTDLDDNYILGKKEVRINIRPAEAAAAGISVADVGNSIRAAFEGIVATTLMSLEEEIDVRVSLSKEERAQDQTIKGLKIPNTRGNLIPLRQIADTTEKQGLLEYEHEDHQRQIRVLGDVDTNISSSREVSNKMRGLLPDIKKMFPKVDIFFGGEDKGTQESIESLGQAFIVAIMGILLILVLTFRQILQPMVIFFVTIPLGVASAVWAFKLHDKPLSFLGIMGVIALGGVIVNNAIVFVDFINRKRREGQDRWQSIIESGKVRLRPIFLTTMTTAVGLMPTSYGLGGLDPFVTHITIILSWGLLIGSSLIIFLLPTGIAILDDVRLFFAKLFKRPVTDKFFVK